MERKLAAILSADVKGYSRLMGEDEEATIRTLTVYRALMTACIQQQRGRVVDSPGDNLLAEFASVVDAVRCAVAIQHELQERNADVPDQRKMEFRIGLNLGDVVIEGERIYGDGVNIAARLESLAEPNGICISGTVYDQVETKLPLTYEYLGEQTVKNIAKPVRVFRVLMNGAATALAEQLMLRQAQPEQETVLLTRTRTTYGRSNITRRAGMMMAGLALVASGMAAVWYLSPSLRTTHRVPLVTEEKPPLPLPDKPSIVVLPFTNMSEDPTQDYFSDGITEDLTTALSQLSSLFVIAHNSAFTYKGKAVKVQEVGRDLGVQYVLEGSVRKANDQVRITAQLVDASTDSHLWAERYDRPLKDIFALQDEIVQKITTTLKLQLTLREQGYLVRKTTVNLEAYDYFLRGLESYNYATQEANAQARRMFEKALELDPQYAEAYAKLSWTRGQAWVYQWVQEPEILEQALALAQKAVSLDASLPGAYTALCYAYLYKRQHEQAMAAAERVIALAPSDAEGFGRLGFVLNFAGRPEEAIGLIEKAMRLNPRYPYNYLSLLGMAYGLTGRYEEAITTLKTGVSRNPDHLPLHLHLAVSYSELGRDEKARAEVAELRRISPNFSLEGLRRVMPFKNPADLERYLAALREAQLPLLSLPNKPSLVVLPFVNISEDPKQAYFSDGLTQDLTSDLSQISSLFVISRNSAFTYKGKAVKLPEVSRELGVRYVVEGSVRKVGDQVRITAQLIDATQDQHLWSERYDRPLTEILTLQDELRQKIVTALKVKLTPDEHERFQRAPTNNLEAYDFHLRGLEAQWRGFYETKKELNEQARQMYEKAIELDPRYAAAYAGLGWTYFLDWFFQWNPNRAQSLERAFTLAQRAVALNDSLPGSQGKRI